MLFKKKSLELIVLYLEYSGFEQEVEPGVVQHLKITTDRSSVRIADFAFRYAKEHNRKKVTCIHKANIQFCSFVTLFFC